VTTKERAVLILASLALVVAAASMALSAYLYSHQHDAAVQGCQRQNGLRRELNATLRTFHEPPRFRAIDCHAAFALRK
jgi:hypothetical protein